MAYRRDLYRHFNAMLLLIATKFIRTFDSIQRTSIKPFNILHMKNKLEMHMGTFQMYTFQKQLDDCKTTKMYMNCYEENFNFFCSRGNRSNINLKIRKKALGSRNEQE